MIQDKKCSVCGKPYAQIWTRDKHERKCEEGELSIEKNDNIQKRNQTP